jgi:hypothetical protein
MSAEGEGVQALDPEVDLPEAAEDADDVAVGDDPSERLEDAPAPAEEDAVDDEVKDT